MYDWSVTTLDQMSYKFFHTDQVLSEDRMWQIIRATEDKRIEAGAAILFLGDGVDAPFNKVTIRDRVYHRVPFSFITAINVAARSKEVERLQLYDVISGACGEK